LRVDGVVTLAIVGPTASGKSEHAMAVARDRIQRGRPTEIVAIDAFTVYRGLDVGTAKPSAADRREVSHHLIDVLEPWEDLTVAQFQMQARQTIDQVVARGVTPLLVGGSGLYWRAVVDDLSFPPTDPDLRARLTATWEQDPAGAHEQLTTRDPAAAAGIDPPNVRRTIRALEVIELTGRPFSSFDDSWDDHRSIYDDLEVAYLEPPAEDLRAAIHRRAHGMVAGGLLREARALLEAPRPLSRTARQAIGYQEAFAVLEGSAPLEELASTIAARTWRYARRQRSWFRADPRCEPVDPLRLRERFARC
jgi:tRNA dimethylallyltransferase